MKRVLVVLAVMGVLSAPVAANAAGSHAPSMRDTNWPCAEC